MATTEEDDPRAEGRLRRIDLAVRPESRFPVPDSDGYIVYSALLAALERADADASARVHDSPFGSLHSSGLIGVFGGSDRDHHKSVRPDETYDLTLGIVDPADREIFQALVNALVLEGDSIELTDGTLTIERFQSENTSHEALLKRANETDDPNVAVSFETPTCIEEADEVTTMFPHRVSVFTSLLGKWNNTSPENLKLDLSREAIRSQVIEKPDARTYSTHSVLVNRVQGSDGNPQPIFRQGFTGDCTYAFKDASESVENAVTALALFGEYSGVGSAVARGCGEMTVERVSR
jgi:CRISPR-associated endoribonuclease Cas6